jgi:GGDEF domain-containing protein
MHLTASIGFAITNSNDPDIDPKQLVRVADWALYDAKRAGRNRVCYYDLAEHPEFMQPHHEKKAL